MGMTGCGYVVVHKDGHHRADKNGFVYEHVLVAEEKNWKRFKSRRGSTPYKSYS